MKLAINWNEPSIATKAEVELALLMFTNAPVWPKVMAELMRLKAIAGDLDEERLAALVMVAYDNV